MTDRAELPTKEDSIAFLAERLYWNMERLDPSDNTPWTALSDDDKRFYRLLVEDLVLFKPWVAAAQAAH